MAFVNAMNSVKKGVNGADVYTETGVGNARVALFSMLNRDLETDYLYGAVKKIVERVDEPLDLFLMAFQTRDVRGGKGERLLFYQWIHVLYHYFPAITAGMLSLVPEYGCWRDLWSIWVKVPELGPVILQLVQKQFMEDLAKAGSGASGVSLLAKWLPREASKTYPGMAGKIAAALYPREKNPRVRYRKETSFINSVLKTVEINMCGGTWRTIQPEAVPGRCLKLHDKAFLNEKGGDLRYPNCDDRMVCREHFHAFLEGLAAGTKKAHGANVVFPHELVLKAQDPSTTADQQVINQAQWESICAETRKLGGLGKAVAICDFSGSMSGIPLQISLALGILISECTHPSFRDYILTFDATPQWHSFVGHTTLKAKLDSLRGCGQGLNTNFYKACQMILARLIQYRVPADEAPEDLIVITDMGFDDASNAVNQSSSSRQSPWETQLTRIRREFQEAGEYLWGKAWKPPRIVVWNVRAAFHDFHAAADQEGVVQLSGWSPSILKALQTGIQATTPYQGMRLVLDDARYDPVRALWKTYAA